MVGWALIIIALFLARATPNGATGKGVIRIVASVLGFDFGLRRIGVAVGQSITHTGSPLATIKAKEGIPDWQQIAKLLEEWKPDVVLVGKPFNMDGSESPMSRRAHKFGNRIHGRFGVKVVMVDERLTSYEVKGQITRQHGAQNFGDFAVDSFAAVLIVEQWLKQVALKSEQ